VHLSSWCVFDGEPAEQENMLQARASLKTEKEITFYYISTNYQKRLQQGT